MSASLHLASASGCSSSALVPKLAKRSSQRVLELGAEMDIDGFGTERARGVEERPGVVGKAAPVMQHGDGLAGVHLAKLELLAEQRHHLVMGPRRGHGSLRESLG